MNPEQIARATDPTADAVRQLRALLVYGPKGELGPAFLVAAGEIEAALARPSQALEVPGAEQSRRLTHIGHPGIELEIRHDADTTIEVTASGEIRAWRDGPPGTIQVSR